MSRIFSKWSILKPLAVIGFLLSLLAVADVQPTHENRQARPQSEWVARLRRNENTARTSTSVQGPSPSAVCTNWTNALIHYYREVQTMTRCHIDRSFMIDRKPFLIKIPQRGDDSRPAVC